MKACPRCGRIVDRCFHYGYHASDGETFEAVEMESSKIRELIHDSIESLESEIERFKVDLKEVEL